MIKNIVFDIGNVLAAYDWNGFIHSLYDDAVAQRITHALHGTGCWNLLDLGEPSSKEVLEMAVLAAPDLEEEIGFVYENLGGVMTRWETSIPWIEEMKAGGCGVFFLSNYSRDLMEKNPDVLDFLPHMDGGVFSCDVHLVKPDPRIYLLLCERYDLKPSECVFIDDTEGNVEAARKLGFTAIRFSGYEKTRRDLAEVLNKS